MTGRSNPAPSRSHFTLGLRRGVVALVAASLAGGALIGAGQANAASAPGTAVISGATPDTIPDSVSFNSILPRQVAVRGPRITVPVVDGLAFTPTNTVYVSWSVCLKKAFGDNVAGDCYFAPLPDSLGRNELPIPVQWTQQAADSWQAKDLSIAYTPRSLVTLGIGRYLFPIMRVTTQRNGITISSTELKPAATDTGALIVYSNSFSESVNTASVKLTTNAASYNTNNNATVTEATSAVNYDLFLNDHGRNALTNYITAISCPATTNIAPKTDTLMINEINNTVKAFGLGGQLERDLDAAGCAVVDIADACPDCRISHDTTHQLGASYSATLPASKLLYANLPIGQSVDVKLYPLQMSVLSSTDENTGDQMEVRNLILGTPKTVRLKAVFNVVLPVVPNLNLGNLVGALQNGAANAPAAGNQQQDAAAAPAADAAAAPAAGNQQQGAAAGQQGAAEGQAAGGQQQAATPAAAPTGLASAAGINLTSAPLAGTDGVGANGASRLRIQVPVVQVRGKQIALRAYLAPRTSGKVKFALIRTTSKGIAVLGKTKTATLSRGKAATKWILAKSKPAGTYTVYASFTPSKGAAAKGVKGVTVGKAITVR